MEHELSLLLKSALSDITEAKTDSELTALHLRLFGKNGVFTAIVKKITALPAEKRPLIGSTINKIKTTLLAEIEKRRHSLGKEAEAEAIDTSIPGIPPQVGHLHLVTQAISEITRIFERIGFTRVRYREVEWEWYAFKSLNMPANHPARDDVETFFMESKASPKYGKMVLSPHTSSGQVREMERLNSTPPIRMINIAKCYRPNWDVSHTPMFHQFEGLVVDRGINITNLKGTLDYFVKQFFGKERKARIRPFHFQFTEPSFEVDITCDVCNGKGCRMCKQGWLELGGAGMVHPNVLRAGKIDPGIYSGFAFGWGIERTYMMKEGLRIDDLRLLYSNDVRFLEQF